MKTTIKNIRKGSLILALGLVLLSCADTKDQETATADVVKVAVQQASQPGENGFFNASGQIEAAQYANISTRMMGYVSKIYVKVGDKVNKGQALIHINNADMEARRAQTQAGISQAEARYFTAEKDLKRFETLYEQNSASQKELDDIRTQYNIAKAGLEAAQQMQKEVDAMLSYTNIKAPFSGIITATSVKSGDMAKPGQHLLSIEAPGDYVATAMLSEKDIPFIQKNDSVMVYVKSNGNSLNGSISEVSSSSQNSGGQYLVKIKLAIPAKTKLYSGMFVSVTIPTEHKMNSEVLIPKAALHMRGDLQGIYTVSESNTAILRWLKLGKSVGDQVEVLSGLTAGESYIIHAEGKLYNGVKIASN
ncbi:efflux RND transporter periplasmic adaptor subunit [Lutimonas sp.]|uniref:efflux RND transporter periplasmic adaptor subunit n=1 Tax=Lutimonas sp. TaxID=1872403 RepID=UPI003D9B53E9